MASDLDLFKEMDKDSKAKLNLDLLTSQDVELTYEEFLSLIHRYLKFFIEEIEKSAEYYTSSTEDAITSMIVTQFNSTRIFKAEAQVYQRGAVDLTVCLQSFTWRAEAKIAYSNDKIFEGLLQLLTRYIVHDKNVGLLVYVKSGSFKEKFISWKDYIKISGGWFKYVTLNKFTENERTVSSILKTIEFIEDADEAASLSHFNCSFELDTGNRVTVGNYFVNNIFKPADISGNKAKKIRIDRANNELKRIYFEHRDQINTLKGEEVMMYLDMLYRDL